MCIYYNRWLDQLGETNWLCLWWGKITILSVNAMVYISHLPPNGCVSMSMNSINEVFSIELQSRVFIVRHLHPYIWFSISYTYFFNIKCLLLLHRLFWMKWKRHTRLVIGNCARLSFNICNKHNLKIHGDRTLPTYGFSLPKNS